MILMQNAIKQFHLKHGFPVDRPLEKMRLRSRLVLWIVNSVLKFCNRLLLSHALKKLADREQSYRIHLCLEELTEMADAFILNDEILLADSIADSLYVNLGVGVVYHIPCEEVLQEVHYSNMSKDVRKEGDKRLRNKGDNYSPPNIELAMMQGRKNHRYF